MTLRSGITCKLAAFTTLLLCVLQLEAGALRLSDRLSCARLPIAGYLIEAFCHRSPAPGRFCLQVVLSAKCACSKLP